MRNLICNLILILFLYFATSQAHDQTVHQHITREAFKLLLKSFPALANSEMAIAIGTNETNLPATQTQSRSWGAGKIVSGAWIEDEYDIVYHYGMGEEPTFSQWYGNAYANLFVDKRAAFTSITHFWNADGGPNAPSDESDIANGNYWSFSCENAMQKMYKYLNGDFDNRWLYKDGVQWPCNGNIYSMVDMKMNNLFSLYNGTKIYGLQYIDVQDGQWHNANRCPEKFYDRPFVYEQLGRMCHLLQDMSVPAHVHCNPHAGTNGMYWDYYERGCVKHMWTADEVYAYGSTYINPYNTWGDPLYYLMYFMNQITDHYASGKSDGDDNYDVTYPGLSSAISTLGAPTTQAQINGLHCDEYCQQMNDKLMPMAIRATAGLLYWFAVQAGIDTGPEVSPFTSGPVSGTITSSIRLGGNIEVVDNVTVTNGAILGIVPGTIVKIASGKKIIIDYYSDTHGPWGAKIIANGTTDNPIRFIRKDATAWDRICIIGKDNQFSNCVFDGGTVGVQTSNYSTVYCSMNNTLTNCRFINNSSCGIYSGGVGYAGGNIYGSGNDITLNNCIIEGNGTGIVTYNGSPTIIQTTIKNNTYDGIWAEYSTITNFTNNVIENNGRYGIDVSLFSTIYMGNGTTPYNSGGNINQLPNPATGAGENRIRNNTSYQIYVEEDAQLYAGSLNGSMLIAGYNKISSANYNYIYNLAMTGEYENQQQWVLPASMTRWGESGGMEGEGIYGQVCYSYQLNFDPSTSAGANTNTVPLKVSNPENASKPATVLTSAIAAKISSTQTTSSQGEFLVDLKNKMIKVRNDFNDPKHRKFRPRLLGDLNDLSMLDPNDATQEKGMIGALLAEYRERLITNKSTTDTTEQLCNEAALVGESKNALRNGDISQVQELLKTYGQYVKNKDNVRSLLFVEMSVYEHVGDYAKAWEKLGAIKAIKPNDDLKKIYVAPSYKIMEERLQEKAKAAGIVLSKQESTEEEQQNTANEQQQPKEISLQNYPNPFNPSTVINYQLSAVSNVKLSIFDIRGREVAVLADGMKQAGHYSATFDASRLSSGIYFSRLTVNPQEGKPIVLTKKMLLMK